ncbi:hypothetical protein [Leptospira sp. P2653]|uniref:hypothetical protein n=1 Tax=Leptospira sp. P2653 TaxID=1218600 RepID=UPI0002BDAB60|nr:hypothetical protein [Leptospira sp. P2653]EMJ66455.1 hypothetical protein LEP1GSC051_1465 [Leptospira sp. P2653]
MNWNRITEIANILERKKVKSKIKELFDRVIDGMQNGNPEVAIGFGRAISDCRDADL